ncbi:hypothetical protein, partial [Pseudomonas sp. I2]|uniref:hypothetical protein n=1 Tax=Pseudomonas sp. I2 TaxID=1338438 RepID=UPI0034D6BEA5
PSPNCSSSSLGILGRSRKGFFLVGIHAPLTHVMPEHKISDTLLGCFAAHRRQATRRRHDNSHIMKYLFHIAAKEIFGSLTCHQNSKNNKIRKTS